MGFLGTSTAVYYYYYYYYYYYHHHHHHHHHQPLTGRSRGRISGPCKNKILLLSTTTRPVVGPIQPPTQWGTGQWIPRAL
jgi:hypothetical protein